jgi:hypothetical protein
MVAPAVPYPDAEGWRYGYGLVVGTQDDHRLIGHGGNIEGFAAQLIHYPDDQATIIVLSNQEDVNAEDIFLNLARMIFEAE